MVGAVTILLNTLRVLLAAALVGASPALADTWNRADSRHFTIYSDGDQRTLQQFAARAEMFDTLFREYFGLQPAAPGTKLTIFLLKDQDDVSDLAGDEDGLLAGFYRATAEGSFAVSNRNRSRRETAMSGQIVLFHEYVHHLMAHNFTYAYPAWYREGFAEYFATATFDRDGDWTLGAPANHRAYALRNVRIPLENVLFGTSDGLSGAGVDAYYGRAWLMVHMFANDPALTAQLNAYLTQLGSGTPPRRAFSATLGDVEELDDRLDDYLRGRLAALESVTPITIPGDVAVVELSDLDSSLAELDMRRRVGRELQTVVARLREIAQANPQSVAALSQLARAERDLAKTADDPDFALALSATDATLALTPADPAMTAIKAQMLMQGDAPDWTAIRAQIAAALEQGSDNPQLLIAHYDSYAQTGQRPPVEVVNGLFRAFRMVPEDHNVRVKTAYAMLNEGLGREAIQLVEFLAGDPHAGAFGRRVLADLRRRVGE